MLKSCYTSRGKGKECFLEFFTLGVKQPSFDLNVDQLFPFPRRAVLGEDWTEDEPLPDYYAVLELTPDASVQDIRRSFR